MGKESVLFRAGESELELIDEPLYSSGSSDNVRPYSREYNFNDTECRPSSRHGLALRESGVLKNSGILLAGGGASGVHEHSAVIAGDTCFVAVGNTLCSFALSSLDLLWRRRIDAATCFGVHYSEKHHCLISHGELEIARVSLSGELEWSSGGADIFTEGFELHSEYIEVVDFNGRVYRMDIATGRSAK